MSTSEQAHEQCPLLMVAVSSRHVSCSQLPSRRLLRSLTHFAGSCPSPSLATPGNNPYGSSDAASSPIKGTTTTVMQRDADLAVSYTHLTLPTIYSV